MDTIRHLLSTTSLSNTNSQKILELEDELSSSLREVIGGRDDLEIAVFTDDEVHALTAIALRVSMLFGFRDMTAWMEEDEGGKQSNAWDILVAVAERGGLGYKEEDQVRFFGSNAAQTEQKLTTRVARRTMSASPCVTRYLEGAEVHRQQVYGGEQRATVAQRAAERSARQGHRVYCRPGLQAVRKCCTRGTFCQEI